MPTVWEDGTQFRSNSSLQAFLRKLMKEKYSYVAFNRTIESVHRGM